MNPGVTHEAAAILPPQNIDAEETLLGALMLASSGPVVDDVIATGLQPADFYRNTSNGRIYQAAVELHRAGTPIDLLTIAEHLQRVGHLDQVGGIEKIRELAISAPVASNAAHYARIVRDLATDRALAAYAQRVAALAHHREGDINDRLEQARQLLDQVTDRTGSRTDRLNVETWAEFEKASHDRIPTIIDGLWPEAALGFVAAPPKKGKTWIGLSLALSVATGKPFLNRFQVPKPQPVIYLALEGHRAAIRTRIGALAHGLGVNPDDPDQLANFRPVYKPRGLNLADPHWIRDIRAAIEETEAKLVVVDVLRAAAAMKENDNDAFNTLRLLLAPITQDGCAIALLHHFGKLTEISKDRTPGERMSGAGAMYGAMDVGLFITGADKEARELRLEFELRDLATPDPIGVKLAGDGTGDNGGFVYRDTARWELQASTPDEDDVHAPAQTIYDLILRNGGVMAASDILLALEADGDGITERTLRNRRPKLAALGVRVEYRGPKRETHYVIPTVEQAAEAHPDHQLDLIAPINNHPGGQGGTETPEAFHPNPLSTHEWLNHADQRNTPETGGNHDLPPSDLAQPSRNGRVETPELSYGESTTADASRPPHHDILFTEAEAHDLEQRLAAAQPEPAPEPEDADDTWLT